MCVWRHLSPRVRVFQRYVPYIEPCTRRFSVIYVYPWVYLDSDVWEVSLDRKVPWNEARKLEAAWIFGERHENFEIVKMQEFHRWRERNEEQRDRTWLKEDDKEIVERNREIKGKKRDIFCTESVKISYF